MKVRNGFVTNSSSSSYIIGFNSKTKLGKFINILRNCKLSLKDVSYVIRSIRHFDMNDYTDRLYDYIAEDYPVLGNNFSSESYKQYISNKLHDYKDVCVVTIWDDWCETADDYIGVEVVRDALDQHPDIIAKWSI